MLRTAIGKAELGYRYLDYKAVSRHDVMLEFRIEGMRYDGVDVDVEFGEGVGVEWMVRVRVWMSDANPAEERRIEGVELVPVEASGDAYGCAGAEQGGNVSLAGLDWGGRRDLDGGYWTGCTFKPGEWNECGRRDDRWSQISSHLEHSGMGLAGLVFLWVYLDLLFCAFRLLSLH